MRDQSKQDQGCVDPYTERLVALQVLLSKGGIHPRRLQLTLRPIEPDLVREAVTRLERAGVVVLKRTRIHPSPALRRIDELHLIAI